MFVSCLVRDPPSHPLQAPAPVNWGSTQHSQTGWNLQYSSAQLKQHQLIQINKTQGSNKAVEAVLLNWNFRFIINPCARQKKDKTELATNSKDQNWRAEYTKENID